MLTKHIVIDARIRRASTGRPVDKLLYHLQQLDHDNRYTVLVEPGDDWRPAAQNFKRVFCRYSQFSLNPLQQLTYALFLYRLKPDLVHFTLTGQQPLMYFGRQLTFTHDLTMYEYARAGRLPQWLHALRVIGYRLLVWSAHRKAANILVPTEYVSKGIAKMHLFTKRKIVVTPESADPPVTQEPAMPVALATFHLPPSTFQYLLYVGSAFPHKNLKRLIKAFEALKPELPELKLIFVGKLEYHARELQKTSESSRFGADILFTGFVSEPELKWLYQHARAYVFPSLSEGFGLPALEAMAHGCPVVSSSTTCLPEVYGNAALYFDPQDIEGMADEIKKVLSSESLRQELVKKGYEQTQKYSWQRMARQTVDIYQELLGS